jgi:hypothetical protein
MLNKEKLIEELAQIIFHSNAGLTDEDYLAMFGEERKGWGKPELDKYCSDCLQEHERDDFRYQAEKVVQYLEEKKIIKF